MNPTTNTEALPETVSQSEIEKLLAQVSEIEDSAPDPAASQTPPQNHFLHKHEFPKLSFFSAAELRKLRMRHEDFINSLTARLAIRFSMELNMQMSKLETMTIESFVEGLANPTHVTALKLEPLRGNCLLDIPLRLGLSMVCREVGGSGAWPDEPRELTKMEAGLLSRIVESVLTEWCSVWGDLLDLRPAIAGSENNGRFLPACPPGTAVLVLGMELQMGSVVQEMQLCLPHPMLEPLMSKLNAVKEAQIPASAPAVKAARWKPLLDDLELGVTANLTGLELSARELTQLKPGDIIPLQAETTRQMQICLEGAPKYVAVLGMIDQRWAAKITDVIPA